MTHINKSKRAKRMSDLIQREVSMLLRTAVLDPRLKSVTVTLVDISPDLKNARIYYSILPDQTEMEIAKAIEKAAGFIRHELAESSGLRYVPNLHFKYDRSVERAGHLLSLINRVQTDDSPQSDDAE